jgi:2,4-dienoyl-CoA reductase (NADPH2)
MAKKLEKLFDPIQIGSLQLPNRIIMAAITTNFDYESLERQVAFFSARAAGGAGMLTLGALQTLYPGRRGHIWSMNLNNDEDIPKLRKLTGAIEQNGSLSMAQLATYGYWAKNGPGSIAEDVAPSAVELSREALHPTYARADIIPKVRQLEREEIQLIVKQVGDAAERASKAGFDAVELQVVGGNLLNRFTNPTTNQRSDDYGGSVKNRARIILEIIAEIKRRIGDDFPLVCRIPGDDLMSFGLKLEGWKDFAPLLEDAGVHAINIMPGWHESKVPRVQMLLPRAGFVYLAEGIKEVVKIPVAAGNNINDPVLAEEIIAEGRADLIAMGRPLLADPELPNKAKQGLVEDIRRCVRCNHCFECLPRLEPVSCAVNAMCGREGTHGIHPASVIKKVTIVGGGPAGMEAARVAAKRGHKVTLFEKNNRLGGQLLYAVLPPYKGEWKSAIDYLTTQVQKMKMTLRLGEEATPRKIKKTLPDALVLATGAEYVLPDIPGIHGANVVTPIQVLTGERTVGRNVVIVGGGSIGCETAEFLSGHDKRVLILEMLPTIAVDLGPYNRWLMIERLIENDVRVETGVKVEEITDKGVWVVRPLSAHDEFFESDTVVVATGTRPVGSLVSAMKNKVPELHIIGDAVSPRKVKEAIEEGFLTALRI